MIVLLSNSYKTICVAVINNVCCVVANMAVIKQLYKTNITREGVMY